MRHELKYILTPAQYTILRNRLKWVLEPDEHAGEKGEYFVRSIYFDSPDKDALRDKKSGENYRKKYRIRFYDGNVNYCKLECKKKTGTRITKLSQDLMREEAEALLRCEGGKFGNGTSLLQTMWYNINSRRFEPVVTVDYLREAFVMPLLDLRITFDKEIAWGPVEKCLVRERYLSNVYTGSVILEVKYNIYLPQHISDILASVRPMQAAVSKYVACAEEKLSAKGY